MLTPRQQLTIERIAEKGIKTPDQIISYCQMKLKQAWAISYTRHPNAERKPRRKHGREYYRQIINHFSK